MPLMSSAAASPKCPVANGLLSIDAEFVNYRLEEAGRTLLSLPGGRMSGRLPSAMPEAVRSAVEAYGYTELPIRPPIPSAAMITRMDEAMAWILLIPLDPPSRHSIEPWSAHGGAVLRRILGARMLVSPVTERHLFSWRRLGLVLSAHHESVKRWHSQAIDRVSAELNRQALTASKNLPLTDTPKIRA